MKTLVRFIAAASLAMVGVLAGATAAHAGVDPASAWLTKPTGSTTCSFSGSQSLTVVGNPGSTFTLYLAFRCYDGGGAKPTISISDSAVVSGPTGMPTSSSLRYTLTSTGSATVSLAYGDARGTATITFNAITTPVTTPQATIHDDLQQVGVPSSGDCADVPETVGHYEGAPIGGWSKSWAWWINGGTGGPVCTRELEELSTGEILIIG